MTVIAWKAGIIAADRCISIGALKVEGDKLFRHGNSVLAFTGPSDFGIALVEWYKRGAKPEEWPDFQKREDYATLVVANPGGVFLYYQTPYPLDRTGEYMAVGDGAQLAIGAMAAGATAVDAVRIANQHGTTCGFGVDVEAFR